MMISFPAATIQYIYHLCPNQQGPISIKGPLPRVTFLASIISTKFWRRRQRSEGPGRLLTSPDPFTLEDSCHVFPSRNILERLEVAAQRNHLVHLAGWCWGWWEGKGGPGEWGRWWVGEWERLGERETPEYWWWWDPETDTVVQNKSYGIESLYDVVL